ncbi:diguanylate cyclase [Vibrio lentus]|nr:diguanylate cyclase [Vibrio lentus]
MVLKTLSRELKNTFRNDDIVCRLGGDTLAICPDTDLGMQNRNDSMKVFIRGRDRQPSLDWQH